MIQINIHCIAMSD